MGALSSGDPQGAGPPNNQIWPAGVAALYGSKQSMVSGALISSPMQSGAVHSATLSADGYFFLANGELSDGEKGDGRYHAIIVSHLNGAAPFEPPGAGLWCGYGLRLSAWFAGSPMAYPTVSSGSTQPRLTNTPPLPGIDLGEFICTRFGYAPTVPILTTIVNSAMTHVGEYIEPQFEQYVNQVSAPGIESYNVYPHDTPATSEVHFSQVTEDWVMGNDAFRESTLAAAAGPPPPPGSGDEFVIVSYLSFAPPADSTSYDVEFVFQVQLCEAMKALMAPAIWSGVGISVSQIVDLVKATALPPGFAAR